MSNQKSEKRIISLASSVRSFNRFYPRRIGILADKVLGTEFSIAESQLIFELKYSGTPTISSLANTLGVDRSYISRLAASLERRQLVERSRSESDGRVRLIELTYQGKEALSILEQRSSMIVREFLETLTRAEQTKLVSAMDTIQDIMKPRLAQGKPIVLRSHRSGDLGWILERHGAIYEREYAFDLSFEVFVAETLAKLTKKFDRANEHIWIAEIDGERVGSIVLARSGRLACELHLFFVEPWARGHGVGKALIQECARFAEKARYRNMTLRTYDILNAAGYSLADAGYRLISQKKQRRFGQDLVAQTWRLTL